MAKTMLNVVLNFLLFFFFTVKNEKFLMEALAAGDGQIAAFWLLDGGSWNATKPVLNHGFQFLWMCVETVSVRAEESCPEA
jgi:hypothetical protein